MRWTAPASGLDIGAALGESGEKLGYGSDADSTRAAHRAAAQSAG